MPSISMILLRLQHVPRYIHLQFSNLGSQKLIRKWLIMHLKNALIFSAPTTSERIICPLLLTSILTLSTTSKKTWFTMNQASITCHIAAQLNNNNMHKEINLLHSSCTVSLHYAKKLHSSQPWEDAVSLPFYKHQSW